MGPFLALFIAGHKTKMSTTVLVSCILLYNVYANSWWTYVDDNARHSHKFEFFQVMHVLQLEFKVHLLSFYNLFKLQTTSVIGGLLLIASLSSVVIPVDDFKKKR